MSSQAVSEKVDPRWNPEKSAPDRGTPKEPRPLTDRELKRLGPGEHVDGKIPGLIFRVRETGGKSWALLYRARGRRRRLTLGSYPGLGLADARAAARAARKAVFLGGDPAAEKREMREAGTFGELADHYMERWAKPRKRTWRDDKHKLDKHVLPRWRHLPAREITRRDVRDLLEKASGSAPVGVNRVRALLSKIFNFGMQNDVVEHNPVMGTMPEPERSRDRVLTEDEIRTFWAATSPKKSDVDEDGMLPAMSVRLRLALVTAQRRGEILEMRWSDVDQAADVWTIPAEKAKNGLAHRVPLSSLALELIDSLPRKRQYVLDGARGERQYREAKNALELGDFVPHDLRRTAASYMASMGVQRLVIGKVLNHVEREVTAIYDRHGYDREKRDALERWAGELRRIIAGESKRGKVMRLR